MILISEALETIKKHVVTLSTEKIDLAESIGRVLAENTFADMDLPPFNRSQMDSLAVRAKRY
jgi:molybdopterin molybdotransferase